METGFDLALFAWRLSELRRQKGFTQFDLAMESEVEQGDLEAVEAEEKAPTVAAVQSLARALKVSPEYLLGLSKDKVPEEDVVGARVVVRDPPVKELEMVLENASGWHSRGFVAPNDEEKDMLRQSLRFSFDLPRELVQFYWDVVPWVLSRLRSLKLLGLDSIKEPE